MKRLFLSLLLVTALATACKKEDTMPKKPTATLDNYELMTSSIGAVFTYKIDGQSDVICTVDQFKVIGFQMQIGQGVVVTNLSDVVLVLSFYKNGQPIDAWVLDRSGQTKRFDAQ